ncbi:creatininase family protein [Sphingoaurantiacus capsulatus]|uniref:Creatininase family protein n=1 Tax=Sphingoaurantiacus capsulatus TaxID=1771310 RepID=A0ABV7XC12_9SPHN
MNDFIRVAAVAGAMLGATPVLAADPPTSPIWHEQKVKNYLPHMSWPEVADLLMRSDLVIIPVAAMEEHGLHGPIGTDFLNSNEEAKLIAQKADILVAPILLPGNSPYHMGFPGTISLPAETIQKVYFEAVQSLIQHGFKRFLLLNGHGGNAATTRFIVDRVNQETPGIAVEVGEAIQPYLAKMRGAEGAKPPVAATPVFDRHGGTPETSSSLYLTPNLLDMSKAKTAPLKLPEHMQKMLPQVVAEDPTAKLVFLAEGLKAKETGKKTSTREMTATGVWGVADFASATAERGKANITRRVDATVQFIEAWNKLRPSGTK